METPRQLRRSATSRVIGGVCGGLAEYFGIDPTIVRIIWIALTILSIGFGGAILYVLAWIVMPAPDSMGKQAGGSEPAVKSLVGFVLIGVGIVLLMAMTLPWTCIIPFSHCFPWFWHMPALIFRFILPLALVVLGIVFLIVGLSNRSQADSIEGGSMSASGEASETGNVEGTKPPVRRLYRSFHNKKIAGICGGLGDYFNIDPTIIRILWLLLLIFYGTGFILYLILWIVVPQESVSITSSTSSPNTP